MSVPFEMLSAPGALIPSLTNLIAAYANKTRSERERAREDKHRDFAQRLQLRGMELQEQNAEFHREATNLERERRVAEFTAQQELREAEDTRREAAHGAGMDDRERALKMQEYEALRMQEQESMEIDEEGEPTGRRTVDPLRRMQLGVELGIESPDALERYMQQRQLQEAQVNMFTGLVDDKGMRHQDINVMSPDQAEETYKGYAGAQPYMQSLDPEMRAIAEALLGRRQDAASAERYRAGGARQGWDLAHDDARRAWGLDPVRETKPEGYLGQEGSAEALRVFEEELRKGFGGMPMRPGRQ